MKDVIVIPRLIAKCMDAKLLSGLSNDSSLHLPYALSNFCSNVYYVVYLGSVFIIVFLFVWIQTAYNVIAYKDKPRLRTALEMLKTTSEIERRLGEVCHSLVFTFYEIWIT